MVFMQHSAATDVGIQRTNNEDAYLSDPAHGLWIVADGMGGHEAGEIASLIAVNSVRDAIYANHPLAEAVRMSHEAIIDAGKNGIGSQGMGSTIVALHSHEKTYQISWVGDSRAYLWDASSQQITQITTDHSYVQMLYESGVISADERATHPEKNIITQCLGSLELENITVDKISGEWPANSRILLCSDGLTDMVSDEIITHTLNTYPSTNDCTNKLIQLALEAGGRDNITVALIVAPTYLSLKLQRWKQHIQQWINKARTFFSLRTSK